MPAPTERKRIGDYYADAAINIAIGLAIIATFAVISECCRYG